MTKKICPACNSKSLSTDSFCMQCGHDIRNVQVETEIPDIPNDKECPECKMGNLKDALTCRNCGYPFSASNEKSEINFGDESSGQSSGAQNMYKGIEISKISSNTRTWDLVLYISLLSIAFIMYSFIGNKSKEVDSNINGQSGLSTSPSQISNAIDTTISTQYNYHPDTVKYSGTSVNNVNQYESNNDSSFISSTGNPNSEIEEQNSGYGPTENISVHFNKKTIKFAYFDILQNRYITDFIYDGASNYSDGLGVVSLNRKDGAINHNGEIVIPIKYDMLGLFNSGLASVGTKKSGEYKFGFINKSDKIIIPQVYELAGDLSEGLAWVVSNGKYGFIDMQGIVIIPFQFDKATYFKNGTSDVELNGKKVKINKLGEIID